MSLLTLVLVLAIAGFCCWIVLQIPMLPIFRKIILGVICLFLVLWVLQSLGVDTGLSTFKLK